MHAVAGRPSSQPPPFDLEPFDRRNIIGGFLLAHGMASLIHAYQTRFLGAFTRAVVELDRGAAIKAFQDLTVKKIRGAPWCSSYGQPGGSC